MVFFFFFFFFFFLVFIAILVVTGSGVYVCMYLFCDIEIESGLVPTCAYVYLVSAEYVGKVHVYLLQGEYQ